MNLTIGTFNILNTCINYSLRRPIILKTIEKMKCDIIGIQEVNFSGNSELKELENYNIDYVGLLTPLFVPIPDFRIDGNAVLLKKNIEIVERYRLEYSDKIRVAQILKLKKDGIEFIFANTHLDYAFDSNRENEIKEYKEFLKQFEGFPIISTGDYNITPTSVAYSMMNNDFKSAYVEANGKEPILTYPTQLDCVLSRKNDCFCFDYI